MEETLRKNKIQHNPLFVLKETKLFENTVEGYILTIKGLEAENEYSKEFFDIALGNKEELPEIEDLLQDYRTYTIPLFKTNNDWIAREKITRDILNTSQQQQPNSRWFVDTFNNKGFILYQTESNIKDGKPEIISEKYYTTNIPHMKKACSKEDISKIEKLLKQFC